MQGSDVQQMVDEFRIRQVLERYCRGVDRLDQELIDSVYWPEATDNHGVYVGPGKDFGAFLVNVWGEGRYAATMHHIAQSNIRVRGAAAAGDTYLTAYHWFEVDGQGHVHIAYARYVDQFEKRAGEWRISDRVVVMEQLEQREVSAIDELSIDLFSRGRQDRHDLSFQAFGI